MVIESEIPQQPIHIVKPVIGLSGIDDTFPEELDGKINKFDFKMLLFRINTPIGYFKLNYLVFQFGNILSIAPSIYFFITKNWVQVYFCGGLLGVNLFAMILYMIFAGKGSIVEMQTCASEFTERYKDQGLEFQFNKKKSRCCYFYTVFITIIENYQLEIRNSNFNSYNINSIDGVNNNYLSINIDNAYCVNNDILTNDRTPLIKK